MARYRISHSHPLLLVLIDACRVPHGRRRLSAASLVIALLLTCGWLVYATGGTRFAHLHIMYLPILLAGLWFKAPGGILAGLAAGLIVGPSMPLNVETGEPQKLFSWLYRSGFFVLVGALIGQMSHLLNLQVDALHAAMDGLSVTYAHTLRTFAGLVAQRDEETGGHCERVAHNACVLGELLGLSKPDLEQLYWAGILHDLGKVTTPAHILLKPGKLTDAEYEEIKKHAAQGADILLSVSDDFAAIAAGVRSHHERWDGRGYPDGLAGTAIPQFGRILAVVDVFEALTSHRPYRGPMQPDEAMMYLAENAGSHFDPSIVPVFESAFNRGRLYPSAQQGFVTEYEAPIRFTLDMEARTTRASST